MRYHVLREAAGSTLESFLTELVGIGPRARLKKAFQAGSVRVNGVAAGRDRRVAEGDVIELAPSDGLYVKSELKIEPAPGAPLEIVAESPRLIVAAKPAGQAVHPLRPDETATLLNALAARYPETAAPLRPDRPLEGGLVHRIDRGTSGLVVCARDAESWDELRALWKERAFEKVYLAWLEGRCAVRGRIELRLEHDPRSRKRMSVAAGTAGGWAAVTSLEPLAVVERQGCAPATLALVRIHTGVMHQIRATTAALGHPVVGDEIYARHAGRARGMPAPLPLDAETKAVFKKHAPRLKGLPAPDGSSLPPGGFFLHALWLRASGVAEFASGLWAEVPEHWRERG